MDCFLMRRRPPKSTRTDTLFPNATLRRSPLELGLDGRLVGLPALLLEVRPAHADDEVLRLGGPVQDWGAEGGRGDQKRRGQGTCHSRSEEHTSELQSLMRNSYAVFCLKKKKQTDRISYKTSLRLTI